MTDTTRAAPIQLGLRQNLGQFALLVGVNALVGGMIGQERTVLPLLADRVFGLTAYTAALTFILAFGATKAATNFFAGTLSDRYGRKPVLVAGWLVGLPIPFLLMWAPTWGWIIFANVLLGVNQGLTWSTTVIMKIDLVGPARRGLAMGLNEAAGYGAVALTALATGFIAGSLRAAARAVLSRRRVRRARPRAVDVVRARDARLRPPRSGHAQVCRRVVHGELSTREVFSLTSFTEPALSSCSQAGMVNNLNDGLAWGIFPLYFAAAGLSVGRIGVLAALYPAVWGLGQLVHRRAFRPDRPQVAHRRRHVHPSRRDRLHRRNKRLRAVGRRRGVARRRDRDGVPDAARRDRRRRPPTWRASSVGIYRLWRDGDSPSARSSPASSPTPLVSRPQYGPWPHSLRSRAS